MKSRFKIGIDLDNTVINYQVGLKFLILKNKMDFESEALQVKDIKNILTKKKGGDKNWQRFQSRLYSKGLDYALPAEGLINFFEELKSDYDFYIVSHKTKRSPINFGFKNLRKPAIKWLKKHKITPDFIKPNQIYFCDSQSEKIKLINNFNFKYFIDDLEEIIFSDKIDKDINMIHFKDINFKDILSKINKNE